MNTRTTKLARAAALITIGTLASCAGEEGEPREHDRVLLLTEDVEEAVNENDFTEADNPTITRVTDGVDESFVDFIREPNGGVGIVATGRYLRHMASLVDEDGASALEVFLSIAPEEDVPQELHDNHDELGHAGRVPEEPRELLAFRQTVYDELCDGGSLSFFQDWWADWHPGYDDNAEGSGQLVGEDSFYVVTGTSAQRALAICLAGPQIAATGNMNLQNWNGTLWQIFYTYNGVTRDHGVGYRSSAIFVGQYRERGWSNVNRNWYWGGAY